MAAWQCEARQEYSRREAATKVGKSKKHALNEGTGTSHVVSTHML